MADCISNAFELDKEDVVIDYPFAGGHITRTYGNKPIPCIQIEMSRALYLSKPWFDLENLKVKPERLNQLQDNFSNALKAYFG